MMRLQIQEGTKYRELQRLLQTAMAGVGLLAGCSGGGVTLPSSPLPPVPAASNATAYVGPQAPGYWTLSVDDTQNVFSYQPLSGATTSGGFALTYGILDLGNLQGVSLGKAVAQPAGGALLRPGGTATFPVTMVQQSDCIPVTGNLRYIYAALLGQTLQEGQNVNSTGYGTFVVSTSSDGTSWNFSDVHNYVLTELQGGAFAAGTENGSDPATFSAACSKNPTTGTVAADANPAFPPDSTGMPSLPSFHFNPAGAFVEDRSTGESWMGFAMPQAAIKPSDVATGTYRGFVFEGITSTPVDTDPVAFAGPSSNASTLQGGRFPNDDLTQTPGTEYNITLGTQSSTLNGVFPNATLTVADVNGYCASVALNDNSVTVGFDANGNEICTAAGVGVISQVSGKYVLYFTSHDGTREQGGTFSYAIQFYLYQQ